ncbi:hypothetical protein PPL_05632 [Heterostelium album PN500]|uniref:Ankyrin repeat protein n=1 Tax=Heterostelium pallidum (strain ATCC 26659 / Pp 5 / PN500) TaxID=670386 RepID=D3BAQ2_HETP5|nr:hypothetical protein PPL_05632 [Heterostelium album PN500]EFA81639.1 hypothetical protein PPL_05632 [Heterostelium album PN500]|eukprot:XP_020433756.1 hypothetical protein PPL_05632 [Heterostelium album PN500]
MERIYIDSRESDKSSLGHIAANRGHFNMIKLLNKHKLLKGNEVDIAVNSGSLEMIRYLIDAGQTVSKASMDNCARSGNFELLKWFHNNRTEGCSVSALDYAAINNRPEIIEWLFANRSEGCSHIAFDWSARNGNMKIIKLLLEKNKNTGVTFSSRAIDMAAERGHLEIIQFITEHHPAVKCTSDAIDNAAANGDLDLVRYLHEHRTEGFSKSSIYQAARGGHLSVVKYLYENTDITLPASTASDSLRNDNLDVVKYLLTTKRVHGESAYHRDVLSQAARIGSLEMITLILSLKRKVKFSHNVQSGIECAIGRGHFDCFIYLYNYYQDHYPNNSIPTLPTTFIYSGQKIMIEHYMENQHRYGPLSSVDCDPRYIVGYSASNEMIKLYIEKNIITKPKMLDTIPNFEDKFLEFVKEKLESSVSKVQVPRQHVSRRQQKKNRKADL